MPVGLDVDRGFDQVQRCFKHAIGGPRPTLLYFSPCKWSLETNRKVFQVSWRRALPWDPLDERTVQKEGSRLVLHHVFAQDKQHSWNLRLLNMLSLLPQLRPIHLDTLLGGALKQRQPFFLRVTRIPLWSTRHLRVYWRFVRPTVGLCGAFLANNG